MSSADADAKVKRTFGDIRHRRPTLFAQSDSSPRVRRPTDVLLMVAALLFLALTWTSAVPPSGFDSDASTMLTGLPDWFGSIWHVGLGMLTLWALFIIVAALVKQRWRLLVDIAAAIVLAIALAAIVHRMATGSWPPVWQDLIANAPPASFPSVRLAVAVVISSTASPHLVMPLRRLGRALVLFGAIAGIGLGLTLMGGAVSSISLGVAAACIVHLVRGSPGGQLSETQVAASLADLGLEVHDITGAPLTTFGVQGLNATDSEGRKLLVRAYGRDAWDGQVLVSFWHSLAYRNSDQRIPTGRLGIVEHQAFVSLRASGFGVQVPAVEVAGATVDGDAFLVTSGESSPVVDFDEGTIDRAFLDSMWSGLVLLHDHRVTHGSISSSTIARAADGSAVFSDFTASSVAPTLHQVQLDRAQALALGALLVSPEQSLEAATVAIGADGVTEVISYLQPQALSTELRHQLKAAKVDLAELRTDAEQATGTSDTELVKLRRASIGGIAQSALILLAAWIIISAVSDVGLSTLIDEFSSADWTWLLAAIVLAQAAPVALAAATLGATLQQLKLWPVVALQYAVTFINLVVPSTAARVATKVRFFQRLGLSVPEALSISALDSVSGFVVQLMVLIFIPLSGAATLGMSANIDISGNTGLIVGVVVVIVALLVITMAVPKLRNLVVPPVKEMLQGLAVLRSWRHVGLLLGGNAAYQLIQAVVLGFSLAAFGGSASLAQLVLINTAVSLIAGFMPIPGGMGISEAAIVAGLSAIGIDNSTAVSTAIGYRLATFYLPPIWGYPNLSWLRKHDYL